MRNTSDPGRRALRLVIWLSAAAVAATLVFAACKGGGGFTLSRPSTVELESLPCPEGVKAELWAELKDALEKALSKTTSTPPAGEANQIDDLGIADNGDGMFTLSWHYRNLGDYDQNGTVAVEDIMPLAEHFGETVPEDDAGRNSLQAVIDGSGNCRIGIEDVTPIAQHYNTDVQHYMLEGAEAQSGPWEPVGEVAQSAGAGEARLEYGHILGGATNLWYHAVPYDAEGNPGEPSNAVLRPSNEPIVYEAGPTSGYQHEEYTFTAVVSGAEPRAYAWDFGGGASPDVSSAVSPAVTLSDAGEYEATLTVTNAYGSDDYPFTLTVSARDTWAHTWGGGGRDEPTNIAVDTEGNVYVVGSAPSFGAVLLKYNPGGDLLCVRSWGGIGGAVDVSVAPENGIYIAGTTRDYGPGEVASALITKFDANCNFQWARAWGGPWRTSGGAVVAIRSGGCYVAGERSKEAYAVDSLFVLRLDGDGNLLQQKAWRPDGFVDVKAAGLDADGSLYIAGSLNNPSLTNEDGLLVKYDAGLNFQWARQWGVQGRDDFGDLRIGQGNSILIAGYTEDGDPEWGNAVLLDFDALGALRRTQLFPVLSGRYPKISLAECNTSWYFAISGYWLKGSLLILDAGADSGVLHEAEELSGCVVECSPSSDAYVLATVTALPWAWSTGAQISGNEFDVDAVEALGENGDWDGQIVELDIEASTPHGHVDGYTPVSDNGDLILMKNSP